jgi:F0F1-type ATP synthase assembly protein I
VNDKKNSNDWQTIFRCFGLTGYLGFIVVGSVLGGLIVGWLLDKVLGGGNVCKIIFMLVGVVAGLYNAYREIIRQIK